MKKSLLFIFAGLIAGQTLYAQDQTPTTPITPVADTLPHSPKLQHHFGVQINELIRQVFNNNNSSTSSTPTNPYLLIYSVNAIKTGWGLRIGGGYNYQKFINDDGVTSADTKRNTYTARLGVEKAFKLSEKWSTGVGIDGIMTYDKNNTKTTVRSFDTTTTTVLSTTKSYGGGAMTWLRYNITPRIQIGTEASFYYLSGDKKQTISVTQRVFNGGTSTVKTTVTPVDGKTSSGTLTLPVAFYLTVVF